MASDQQTREDMIGIAAADMHEGDPNTLQVYREFDTSMMTAHRRGDVPSRLDAECTARILLGYPDLPLVLRARACMILGCGNEDDFITWAEEGVRIARLAMDLARAAPPEAGGVGRVETKLLANCEQVLGEARAAKERIDQRQAGEDGEEVANEDIIEVVWQDDAGEVRDLGSTHSAGEPTEPESSLKKVTKKRVRRVHSGDTDTDPFLYQEFDLATNSWVNLGSAINPQYITMDVGEEELLDDPLTTDPPEMEELLDNPPFTHPLEEEEEGGDSEMLDEPSLEEIEGEDSEMLDEPSLDKGDETGGVGVDQQ